MIRHSITVAALAVFWLGDYLRGSIPLLVAATILTALLNEGGYLAVGILSFFLGLALCSPEKASR